MQPSRPLVLPAALVAVWVGYLACSTPSQTSQSPSTADRVSNQRARTADAGPVAASTRDLEIPGVDAASGPPRALRHRLERSDGGTTATASTARKRSVAFDSGNRQLVGTVDFPETPQEGASPAVALLHDSGPLSRHGYMTGQFMTHFGFELPVYDQLAAALTDAGYVVLRYDKRNCRAETNKHCSGNDYPALGDNVAIGTFLKDGSAALSWLRERSYTDPDRIYAVGHGQGGVFVPHLMHDQEWLAGGALLASPHAPIDRMYRLQAKLMRRMLQKAGMPEDRIRQLDPMRRVDRMADALEQVRDGAFDRDRLAGASVAFWQSWMQLGDATPDLAAKLDRPVLVVSGEYDYNVPPSQLEQWRSTLAPSEDDSNHTVELLDCVTHALNCITEPNPMKVEPDDITEHVDERVTNALLAFLERTEP